MEKSWNCVFEFLWEPCVKDNCIHRKSLLVRKGVHILLFYPEFMVPTIFARGCTPWRFS